MISDFLSLFLADIWTIWGLLLQVHFRQWNSSQTSTSRRTLHGVAESFHSSHWWSWQLERDPLRIAAAKSYARLLRLSAKAILNSFAPVSWFFFILENDKFLGFRMDCNIFKKRTITLPVSIHSPSAVNFRGPQLEWSWGKVRWVDVRSCRRCQWYISGFGDKQER